MINTLVYKGTIKGYNTTKIEWEYSINSRNIYIQFLSSNATVRSYCLLKSSRSK